MSAGLQQGAHVGGSSPHHGGAGGRPQQGDAPGAAQATHGGAAQQKDPEGQPDGGSGGHLARVEGCMRSGLCWKAGSSSFQRLAVCTHLPCLVLLLSVTRSSTAQCITSSASSQG